MALYSYGGWTIKYFSHAKQGTTAHALELQRKLCKPDRLTTSVMMCPG
jgi:hypothetical protein